MNRIKCFFSYLFRETYWQEGVCERRSLEADHCEISKSQKQLGLQSLTEPSSLLLLQPISKSRKRGYFSRETVDIL